MISYIELSIDELCPYVRKAGIQVRSLGINALRKIYDYEMLYCARGNALLSINCEKFKISEGTLITIPPNTGHSIWIEDYNTPLIYWVHFDFLYRRDVYNLEKLVTDHNNVLYRNKLINENYIRQAVKFEEGFTLPYHLIIENQIILKECFELLVNAYEKHRKFWQMESKIILLQILQQVFLQLYRKDPILQLKDKNIEEVIMKYIIKNYNQKIRLPELANLVSLSEDYLGKIFKKNTGNTIIEFLNKLRVSKAKELLVDKRLSIECISEMVGFSDVCYFSRVMKKLEGISPNKWRKNY